MKTMLRKLTARAIAALTMGVAATAIAAGTAAAAPAPTTGISTDILPGIHYTGDNSDQSVHIATPFGTLTTQGGQFQVQDSHGATVAGVPFATMPNAVQDAAPTDVVVPTIQHVAAPQFVDAEDDINAAVGTVSTNFGLATGVGAMVGGVAGVIIGCPIGALTFGLTAIPTGPIAIPAAAFGCLVGAATIGTIGPIVGGALLGVPVGVASAIHEYDRLHANGTL